MSLKKSKILFIVNSSAFFYSHFLTLAQHSLKYGCTVIIAAGDSIKRKELESKGFTFVLIDLSRDGRNPLCELKAILSVYQVVKSTKPDIMHMFTIKPIIYGCLVNKLFPGVRVSKSIASITGLGSLSLKAGVVGQFFWWGINNLYKFVLSLPSTQVVFENIDDRRLFIQSGVITENRAFLINGAGVDTTKFCPGQIDKGSPLIVVLVARLLKDKGVREYIEAGKLLKRQALDIRLLLVGSIDGGNISSMTQAEIDQADSGGYIEYLGQRNDIAEIYQRANVACLPSYREGLPKSLIEAAACGLAIVTTDVPGCRQMVFDGQNGVLVPPGNAKALAEQFVYLSLNPCLVEEMGLKSREKALQLFDHSSVLNSFFNIYQLDCNEG